MIFIFLALHLFFISTHNILSRKLLKENYNRFQLGILLSAGLAGGSLITWIIKYKTFDEMCNQISSLNLKSWILILSASIVYLFTVTFPMSALSHCDVNTYTLLSNIRIVLVPIFALLLLDEKYNRLRLVGGLIILISILLLTYRGKRIVDKKGLILSLSAGLSFAIINLLEKEILKTASEFTYMTLGFSLGLLWLVIYSKIVDKNPKTKLSSLLKNKYILAIMVCKYGSALFYISALTIGDVSLAAFVSSSSIIFIAIAGYFLLNEKDHIGTKIVSTMIAVVGLVVIYISG